MKLIKTRNGRRMTKAKGRGEVTSRQKGAKGGPSGWPEISARVVHLNQNNSIKSHTIIKVNNMI